MENDLRVGSTLRSSIATERWRLVIWLLVLSLLVSGYAAGRILAPTAHGVLGSITPHGWEARRH